MEEMKTWLTKSYFSFSLKTGLCRFDLRLSQYSSRGLMVSHCHRIHSSLTPVHCLYDGYVGKQPVAGKEYCVDYWLKELESMDSCTGRCDINEMMLKMTLNTIQSINQSVSLNIFIDFYASNFC